jgi:GAF domain-containing protein/anti-sigma regulatory factor (Ser/Thr protein kinase)
MGAALAQGNAEHEALIEAHGVVSAILVPLHGGEDRIGLLVLNYTTVSNRRYRPDDVALAEALAHRFTEAVDTGRLRAAARRSQGRVDLLARAGELLTVELDPHARMERFVGLAVPGFSDVCAVSVLDPDGSFRLAHVAVAHPARGDAEFAASWAPLTADGASPSATALRTRKPVLIPDVASSSLFATLGPDRSGLARRAGLRSLLCVPLVVDDGRVLGTVTFATTGPGRRYHDDDIPVAVELGRRGAAAFGHALRYEKERAAAESLQRSLLPERLPALSTARLTARYLPAAEGMRVGGDWYDAVPLEDGRLVLAIGDVVGHGLAAASSTGRLRAALELSALDGFSPAVILDRLNRYLFSVPDADMATVAVLVYDAAGGEVRLATAGHPPVLVVEPDGARYLAHHPGPPLRAVEDAVYRERVEQLAPGETLLLFTDGLVERRGESLDAGLERLRASAARAPTDLDALADHLLDELLPTREPDDDVALVGLRGVVASDGLHLDVPAWPRELAGLRRTTRAWLTGIGVAAPAADDIVVAVNEAAANAVEHAYGLRDAQFAVRAHRDADQVVVEIFDSGNWRTERATPDRGRGLDLIRALMSTVDVVVGSSGTTVRLTRRVEGSSAGATT